LGDSPAKHLTLSLLEKRYYRCPCTARTHAYTIMNPASLSCRNQVLVIKSYRARRIYVGAGEPPACWFLWRGPGVKNGCRSIPYFCLLAAKPALKQFSPFNMSSFYSALEPYYCPGASRCVAPESRPHPAICRGFRKSVPADSRYPTRIIRTVDYGYFWEKGLLTLVSFRSDSSVVLATVFRLAAGHQWYCYLAISPEGERHQK